MAAAAAAQCLEPKSALRQFSKLVIVVGVGAFDSEQDVSSASMQGRRKKNDVDFYYFYLC